MTITATFTCDACPEPVQVTLQMPVGTSLRQVAEDLTAIDLESRVTHDLAVHLDGVPA